MTRQPGREEILIPFTREKRAAVHCVLICQILGIARTDDLAAGFVSEEPCWKREQDTGTLLNTRRRVLLWGEARGGFLHPSFERKNLLRDIAKHWSDTGH